MDKNNFSDLYKASHKDLYRYCRNLCGNDADAQDLMQQTYLKALENFDRFYDENFSFWLYSVARNIFFNNLKRNKFEYPTEEYPEIPDNSRNPEFIAEKRDIGRILLKALKNSLPPVQRMTVILYYYDEKSVSEIARIMHCSVGTVESRLYYARKKLREELKKFGNIFTCLSLATATVKYKLKNIQIPINARITASAVLTVTAMTAVSMTNIQTENKLPDTVITINETGISESQTTRENKTVIQKSSETAFIEPVSHAETSIVYHTMPADESHTTAFKSEYEEISETETEELTEEEISQEEGDTPEQPPTTTETITEYEEETTMKKEIITIATAATMAVSGITATTAYSTDDIFDGYSYTKYTFDELLNMSDSDFIELDSYKGDIPREYWTSSTMYRCIYKILNGSGGVRINLDDDFSDFDQYAKSWDIGTEKMLFEIPSDPETQKKIRQEIKDITGISYSDEICSIVKLDNIEGVDTGTGEYLTVSFMSPVFVLDTNQYEFDYEEFADEMENIFSQYLDYTVSEENSHVFVSFEIPECHTVNQENLLYFAKLYYALTSINKNFYYSNFYSMSEESTDIIFGDSNLDGNVTISDSVAILQYVSNTEKYPLDDNARANADVYNPGDGITGSDANSIMKLDAGIIDSLPEVIS